MIRLFLHELRAEQRLFWRSREAAFFTFFLPIVILLLAGSVYGSKRIDGIKAATYLVAGFLGFGVVATAFAGLAITLVIRRESGVLKRVRGTPLPGAVYLAAVIVSTLIVIALEGTTQVLIGRFLLGASWPGSPAALVLALLLGAASFAGLGLALTAAVQTAEGSSGVVNAVYLPMVFISGVFWSVHSMPAFLRAIADVLPLTYLLKLIRDVFIRGHGLGSSPGSVAVVAVWGAVGVVVASRMFRWEPREV